MNSTREKGVTTIPQEATSSPAALDAWVARATHGLCAQAKERVRREIASHYAEAVEDSCASGLSPKAASTRAIEGLGDAAKANKALRKAYLTTWQERLLAELAEPPAPMTVAQYEGLVTISSYFSLFALALVCFDYGRTRYERLSGAILFSTVIVIGLLGVLVRGLGRLYRKRAGIQTAPDVHPPMNRRYPWVMIVCSVGLYIIWRAFYIGGHGLMVDFFFLVTLREHFLRLHRIAGHTSFGPQHTLPASYGVRALYGAFLALAFVACICFPPAWIMLRELFHSFAGAPPVFVPSSNAGDDFGFVMSALVGIACSGVFCIAAIRWMLGLYLLRKVMNDDGPTEPGPAPYPETPLGE